MKKALLACTMFAALGSTESSAQAWSEDFNSGLPATWTMVNQDNHTVNPGLSNYIPGLDATLTANAWAPVSASATNKLMATTSYFSPAATADRWLISPSFQVTSANMYLTWEDFTPDSQFPDSLEILVSTTAGTTPASFTTTLYNNKGSLGGFAVHGVSLGAYNGQTIRLAFRDHSTDEYVLFLDNVATQVLPQNDLQLALISPNADHPVTYNTVGNSYKISGVVKNNGYQAITSYTVKYQVGSNSPVSQTISANIPMLGLATFSLTTPVQIASLGKTGVKVWVELSGDNNHANDTLGTHTYGVNYKPTKKIMYEEATGTWCQWCPRGAVYMDSMQKVHPHEVTLVAVHNQDPMTVSAYDAMLGNVPGFSGYPGVVVDRREVIDPDEMFTVYNTEKDYFGFADINFTKPVISGTNLSTTVTVKPAIDLSGDYRLAMVITEEDVHGTSSSYAQVNVYNGNAGNPNVGPLVGAGLNWNTAGNPVPASMMYYDFVARAIEPSPTGAAGSLPATMIAGTNYTYNFNTTLNAAWDVNKIRVAVLMIRNSDGMVLNSNSTVWPTNVKDINFQGTVNIYPNPAKDFAIVAMDLTKEANVAIQVTDVTGRIVMQNAGENMNTGKHEVKISTASLPAGIYNVKIQTENSSRTERLTVIK